MRSRFQIIRLLCIWPVEIGAIIADYEQPTDEEVILYKIKNRRHPSVHFNILCGNSYFFTAYFYAGYSGVRVSLNAFFYHMSIESLLPSTPFKNSWVATLPHSAFRPQQDVSIWDSYCELMQNIIQQTRKRLDEIEYRNPKKEARRLRQKFKKMIPRKEIKRERLHQAKKGRNNSF